MCLREENNMVIELKENEKPKKIILVPYPAQGHVTPMLKLASAFHSRGFHPIVATPAFIHRSIAPPETDGLTFVSLPDGGEGAPGDFFPVERSMETVMPVHLERLIHEMDDGDGGGVACVVVDLVASWAIEVANKCGVPVAGFWPAMAATYRLIEAIPDMIESGLISRDTGSPQHPNTISSLQKNQTILSTEDLPWLIGTPAARKARFKFWNRALSRSRSLKWLLLNSFPNEHCTSKHQQVLTTTTQGQLGPYPLLLPIGPLALTHQKITKNPSLWEEDKTCLEWLDQHKAGSVVYVSFGSWVSPIGEANVHSLALSLEASKRPFLWVLRPDWRAGLPKGYPERSKVGKVVGWAPQVEVLGHVAVGCYLTHCGWNSTMEAIESKKRMLCYPVAGDQFVNCNYIVKVWRIGARLGSLGVEDVEDGLREVMEDGDMERRLERVRELTVEEEARSLVVNNLSGFVKDLHNLMPHSCSCS